MRLVGQLEIEPVPVHVDPNIAVDDSGAALDGSANPFTPGAQGSRVGRSLQTAFGEIIRHIGAQTPVVVVVGSAGTGKTLLADMVARTCSDMGISIRRAERGDL